MSENHDETVHGSNAVHDAGSGHDWSDFSSEAPRSRRIRVKAGSRPSAAVILDTLVEHAPVLPRHDHPGQSGQDRADEDRAGPTTGPSPGDDPGQARPEPATGDQLPVSQPEGSSLRRDGALASGLSGIRHLVDLALGHRMAGRAPAEPAPLSGIAAAIDEAERAARTALAAPDASSPDASGNPTGTGNPDTDPGPAAPDRLPAATGLPLDHPARFLGSDPIADAPAPAAQGQAADPQGPDPGKLVFADPFADATDTLNFHPGGKVMPAPTDPRLKLVETSKPAGAPPAPASPPQVPTPPEPPSRPVAPTLPPQKPGAPVTDLGNAKRMVDEQMGEGWSVANPDAFAGVLMAYASNGLAREVVQVVNRAVDSLDELSLATKAIVAALARIEAAIERGDLGHG